MRSTDKATKGKAGEEVERFVSAMEATREVPTLRSYAKSFFVWGEWRWIEARQAWALRVSGCGAANNLPPRSYRRRFGVVCNR